MKLTKNDKARLRTWKEMEYYPVAAAPSQKGDMPMLWTVVGCIVGRLADEAKTRSARRRLRRIVEAATLVLNFLRSAE